MTGHVFLVPVLFLALFLGTAGCMTYSIGDLTSNSGNLIVQITNNGDPVDAGVQVTVYTLSEFEQHELLTTGTTVRLDKGNTVVTVPVGLAPGRYKIYVYLIKDGQRESAVIRDITV